MPPIDNQQPRNSASHFIRDLVVFVIIALVIVIPIRLYVAQPFVVSGSSMYPTFATGQYLIVNQISYHFDNPERGQVIIFRYPLDPTQYYIKRVIGLPNETVSIQGSAVTIKNAAHPDGFVLDEPYVLPADAAQNSMSITLGPDQYFVMGDNRIASSDSRSWGPVPRNLIIGTPVARLFPFSTLGVNPGFYQEPAGEQ